MQQKAQRTQAEPQLVPPQWLVACVLPVQDVL